MGRVSIKILQEYVDPDEYAWVNENDEQLVPIRIDMPEPSNIERIHGYGKPANEQTFEYERKPNGLSYLENKIRYKVRRENKRASTAELEQIFNDEIWDELYEKYEQYKYEINWIKWQWHYRLHGKWYFINGKPTYLNNWHWFYLNYWHLEGVGLPEYRDRDRRWFHAQKYAALTTERPKLNINNEPMRRPDGSIVMEDAGIRTMYGTNNLKARRVGETSKTQSIGYNIISLGKEMRGGIQADKESTASYVFSDKLIFPFRKLPFFFRPTVTNPIPKAELEFDSREHDRGIQSKIDYATTVKRTYYDGTRLNFVHVDEAGKLDKIESVKARHEVLKRCMYQGMNIIGIMIYTSTVEDMSMEAGKEFLKLAEESHFDQRNEVGRTESGLMNVMFKSVDGLEGFVGKFGESVIEKPTPEQTEFLSVKATDSKGEYMGAREYIESDRRSKRRRNNMEGLTAAKRLHPMSYKEAFTPPARNTFFNMDVIERRMGELQFDNTKTSTGNFEWINGFGSRVEFHEKDEGRFKITERLEDQQANKKMKKGEHWRPQNGFKYVACGDAFRLEKTEGGRMSNGGGAVLKVYDESKDPPDKQPQDYETNKFVCAYRYRPPTPEEYVEDMLKMCIYYGAYMYPENNIDEIERRFKEWKFRGYLLYDIDTKTGKKRNTAGFFSGGGSKQSLFNRGIEYIDNHGENCDIIEVLEEFGEISGLDDMTNYDLLTSVLGCLRGQEEILKRTARMSNSEGIDVSEFFSYRLR